VKDKTIQETDPISRRLREAEQKVTILHEITRYVSSLLDLQLVLDAIVDLLCKEFRLDACSIRLLDIDGKLRIKSQKGLSKAFLEQSTREPTVDCYSGDCFLTGSIVIVNDVIYVISNQIGMAIRISQVYEEVHNLNRSLKQKVSERTAELEARTRQLIEVERLAAVGGMSKRIAHELRNSLTVVGGLARRLYERPAENDHDRQYHKIIFEEVKILEEKVSNLIKLDGDIR